MRQRFAIITAGVLCVCSGAAVAQATALSSAQDGAAWPSFAKARLGPPPAPWRYVGLPKSSLPATQFDVVELDGQHVLRVQADASYGNLVHEVQGPLRRLGWRWRLDKTLAASDLNNKGGDDVALKVCVLFDMPTQQLPLAERLQLSLARTLSGEALPAATLCYVWDRLLPVGTVLVNAYTRRVRYWVLESGADKLRQWLNHERDLSADFAVAFAGESRQVPAVSAIAIGADADNTGGHSLGYVAEVHVAP